MSINVTPIPRLTQLVAPAFTLGTANAAGDAITSIASNSTLLAFDAVAPANVVAGSAVVGTATTVSRRDHQHTDPAYHAAVVSKIVTGSRTAAAGAGDQAITGMGFQPTNLDVHLIVDSSTFAAVGFSDDDLGEEGIEYRAGTWTRRAGEIGRVGDGSHAMACVVKSYDADGLTLTWTKTGNGQNVQFQILGRK